HATPGKRPGSGGNCDVVRGLSDLEVTVSTEFLLERIRREDRREAVVSIAPQPHAGIVLNVRLGYSDLDRVPSLHHGRYARDRCGSNPAERQVQEAPFVMGKEALFLRIISAVVTGEIQADLLAVNLHFALVQGSLHPIRRP